MRQIVETLTALAAAAPPQLPRVEVPALPDFGALAPLAGAMSGNAGEAASLTAALQGHGRERAEVGAILGRSGPLIDATGHDLARIGADLLRRALPLAAPLLLPDPAGQARARAVVSELSAGALTEAQHRLTRLEQELAPLAGQLHEIAALPDHVRPGSDAPWPVAPESEPAPEAPAPEAPAPEAPAPEAPAPEAPAPEPSPVAATVGEAVPAAEPEAEPEPDHEPDPDPEADPGAIAGQAAAQAALTQLGTPYVWGGTGAGGFDCSGLTQWAYREAGIELPRLAEEQAVGRQVSADELRPGDLVVWSGHVAMYTGDGLMVEAGDPVQTNPVRTTNIGMPFQGFWRPTG